MWEHNAFPEKPREERWLHLPLHSEPSHACGTPGGGRDSHCSTLLQGAACGSSQRWETCWRNSWLWGQRTLAVEHPGQGSWAAPMTGPLSEYIPWCIQHPALGMVGFQEAGSLPGGYGGDKLHRSSIWSPCTGCMTLGKSIYLLASINLICKRGAI